MNDPARYYVLRAEHLPVSDGFSTAEEAIEHAERKVQSDRIPRMVVRMVTSHAADPVPAVVTLRYGYTRTMSESLGEFQIRSVVDFGDRPLPAEFVLLADTLNKEGRLG